MVAISWRIQACWNLAVICCGSRGGLPRLVSMASVDTNEADGLADQGQLEQVFGGGKSSVASSAQGRSELLVLAPAFFKVSWLLPERLTLFMGSVVIPGAIPLKHQMGVNIQQ